MEFLPFMKSKIEVIALVVDDPVPRGALTRILNAADMRVSGYESGDKFLIFLPHQVPDCLVLSLDLAGMNGFDVLTELLQQAISVPIVVTTNVESSVDRELAFSLGANDYLCKPFTILRLIDAITAAVLQHSFSQRRNTLATVSP